MKAAPPPRCGRKGKPVNYMENISGRGEKVIARCFGGGGAVCVVWDSADTRYGPKVYLTTEELLPQVLAGTSALGPIGFPAEDVFCYEEEAATDLQNVDWSRLKLWQAGG